MQKKMKSQQTSWQGIVICQRLLAGIRRLATKAGALSFAILAIVAYLMWVNRFRIFPAHRYITLERLLLETGLVAAYVLVFFFLVLVLGTPPGAYASMVGLDRIALHNSFGEVPILLSRERKTKGSPVVCLQFLSYGVPLQTWLARQKEIESALDLHIADIRQGDDMRHIVIYATPGKMMLPKRVMWEAGNLSPADFVLALGVGYLGIVSIDLAKYAHVLLGGTTGSGKSVLLKLILYQCVQKGAMVCIADFKGGVDFEKYWKMHCCMVTTPENMLEMVKQSVQELTKREQLLARTNFTNIQEYNKGASIKLRRIILACDELAELLDKTGLDKEQKQLITEIEGYIKTIARKGRALGLHLILATQRPDSNILSGQIKSNIACRICGHADNVLSQIILDNTSASDEIPKDAQGRFIMHDGTVFQAYMLGSEYKKGIR